jgi:hypothetical protein
MTVLKRYAHLEDLNAQAMVIYNRCRVKGYSHVQAMNEVVAFVRYGTVPAWF